MLSDEEKQAIGFIKSELQDEKKIRNDYQSLTGLYGNLEIEIILNLIEKQSKEIEELKDEYNIKLLSNEGIYLLGFKDGRNSVKNKIKTKIEEIDKILERNLLVDRLRDYFDVQKEVLHSLLEKE